MREETLGMVLLGRKLEIQPVIEHNLAHIAMLREENKQIIDELMRGLVEHEGCNRQVWGRAIMTSALTDETVVVNGQVLYIERAGLTTEEEHEKFDSVAIVKTVEEIEETRIVRFFNPFLHSFDMIPVELDET